MTRDQPDETTARTIAHGRYHVVDMVWPTVIAFVVGLWLGVHVA